MAGAPAATSSPRAGRERSNARVALVAVAAIVGAQFLLVLVFSWSSSRQAPHALPIAVAGPPQAAQGLAQGLAHSEPGAFAVTVLPDDTAARGAVSNRRVYAAVSLMATGATLYTASAASPTVSQTLAQTVPAAVARALPSVTVTVIDLAPNPTHDPHGASIPGALIPLTITSIAAGAVTGLLVRGRAARIAALTGYTIAAGALATLALQSVLGGLSGPWLANAGVLALGAGAIATATTGLYAVAGIAGIATSAIVVFFLGFPFSGATTAWQLVPTPWGHLGQFLPVGATNAALRSVAFFDAARAAGPLTVLAGWALVGLVLVLLARASRTAAGPA
ncbi:MAG TPA: hypothetical protein VIM19_03040 [Actinomycetes bacterium]